MAKETATPAPAETKAEKKPEKKAPAESVYTVSELAGNARSVFGTMQECVVAALKTDGKAEYLSLIHIYMQKEPSMSYTDALAKAWEDNPDLMDAYDAEEGF